VKTKSILAIIVLSAILSSCINRNDDQEDLKNEKVIINNKLETLNNKNSVSDSLKNESLLNENQSTNTNQVETVDPNQLGTPPTRP